MAAALMTDRQSRFLFALMRDNGVLNRHEWARGVLGRRVSSFKSLTIDEAGRLINELAPPVEPIPFEEEAF